MLLSGLSVALSMALQAGSPALRGIEPVHVRAEVICFYAIVQVPRTPENAASLNAGLAHFRARARTQLTADQFDQMLRSMIVDGSMAREMPAARAACFAQGVQLGYELMASGQMLTALANETPTQP